MGLMEQLYLPAIAAGVGTTVRHLTETLLGRGDIQTQQFPDGTRYGEFRIGGTSLSSPIMAGIMALADQAAGSPHGFANPVFYSVLAGSTAVRDVTAPQSTVAAVRTDYCDFVSPANGIFYSLRTMDQDLSLRTTPGWDDVTGIGTPSAGFIGALSH